MTAEVVPDVISSAPPEATRAAPEGIVSHAEAGARQHSELGSPQVEGRVDIAADELKTPEQPTDTAADHDSPAQRLQHQARQALDAFEASVQRFESERESLFGLPKKPPHPSLAMLRNIGINIGRIFTDIARDLSIPDTTSAREKDVTVQIAHRDAFLDDPEMKALLKIEPNKEVIHAFMRRELYQEVNCHHFAVVKGLTTAELHQLMRQLGHNPAAVLSGDREENAGRIVTDNAAENGQHPLDPNQTKNQEEMAYWGKVFPNAPDSTPWGKWRVSRTHGVVYSVEDATGATAHLVPIHVDPKNVSIAALEKLGLSKLGGADAMRFHRIAVEGDKTYVGTGLYELGCKYFLHLMENARDAGLIKKLNVYGEGALQTTNTITGDTALTLAIEREFRARMGQSAKN